MKMMRTLTSTLTSTFVAVSLLFLSSALIAQDRTMRGSDYCSAKRMKQFETLFKESSALLAPQHAYDVLNYTLSLDLYGNFLSPFPKTYKATNIITLLVDSTLNTIQL